MLWFDEKSISNIHLGTSPWLISLQHWLLFFLILFYSFFRRSCKSAWSQLRLSPMFGCICPNKGQNATCDQVFKAVNGNPCIGKCCWYCFVLLLYYPNDVCKYWCILQKKRCLYVWWNDLRRLKYRIFSMKSTSQKKNHSFFPWNRFHEKKSIHFCVKLISRKNVYFFCEINFTKNHSYVPWK